MLISEQAQDTGYHDTALQLTERMLELFTAHGISEHYDGTTGEALGVEGLGMNCAVWSIIVENVYGLQSDFRTIHINEQE